MDLNGFSQSQITQIEEGRQAGVDVSVYARKEFAAMHMRQIRLGLMEGLAVERYATPEYDWFQMEEIRLGMEEGIDINCYASPEIPYEKMRQIRKGLVAGVVLTAYLGLEPGILRQLRKAAVAKVDIRDYIEAGYRAEQLEEIRLALEKKLDIGPYLSKDLRGDAIQEIRLGLEAGIDVSLYAKAHFCWQQMREIRLGLENRVDVQYYLKEFFAWQQMHEIRLGLEQGVDVSRYADLMYTAKDMKRIRQSMKHGVDKQIYAPGRAMQKQVRHASVKTAAAKAGWGPGIHHNPKPAAAGGEAEGTAPEYTPGPAEPGRMAEPDRTAVQENPEVIGGRTDPTDVMESAREDSGEAVRQADPAPEQSVSTSGVKPAEGLAVSFKAGDMEAYLTYKPEIRSYSYASLIEGLKRQGVVQGFENDEINRILTDGGQDGEAVLVAKGRPAEKGKDGWFEYFFRTKVTRSPKQLADGSVDFKDVDLFEVVKKEQKLACYHEAEPGTAGYTVRGKVLPSPKGKEKPRLTGEGFTVLGDGNTYVASLSGRVDLKDTKLTVTNVFVFDEVTTATGDVNVDGNVYIKNNVGSGTTIRATGDIMVDGYIESATLDCGGSVIIKKGMNASDGRGIVNAGQNVTAKFFEKVRVQAKGDIRANSCMECQLHTDGQLIISGGSLIGGTAYAAQGLSARNVGNRIGLKTVIEIGKSEENVDKMREIEKKIADVSKEIEMYQEAYDDMQQTYAPETRNSMDVYVKAEEALYKKKEQLKQLLKEKQSIGKDDRNSMLASASITGNLYSGVEFRINRQRWTSKDYQYVRVQSTENGIEVSKLKA